METDVAILTYKINLRRSLVKHRTKKQLKAWWKSRRTLNKYLRVGKRVAKWAIAPENKRRKITTKDTKHLGKIPSAVSNQIIRKYKNNKVIKNVSNVNLIVPACSTAKNPSVRHDRKKGILRLVPLRLNLKWSCPVSYTKINQVELNNKYVYVCVTTTVAEKKEYQKTVGVDLNIKHNLATVGEPTKQTYQYLGKNYIYERIKYRAIRRRLQRQGKDRTLKRFGDKEHRLMNDLNHKISKKIVQFAAENSSNIAMEDLSGIRSASCTRSFRYFLNSWSFYQLRLFVSYKSAAAGIDTVFVDPKFTSQDCSSCGARTKTKGKWYTCNHCGLEIHRDKNAAFNISKRGTQSLASSS